MVLVAEQTTADIAAASPLGYQQAGRCRFHDILVADEDLCCRCCPLRGLRFDQQAPQLEAMVRTDRKKASRLIGFSFIALFRAQAISFFFAFASDFQASPVYAIEVATGVTNIRSFQIRMRRDISRKHPSRLFGRREKITLRRPRNPEQ